MISHADNLGSGNGESAGVGGGTHSQVMAELADPHRSRGARQLLMSNVDWAQSVPDEVLEAVIKSAAADAASEHVGARRSGRSDLIAIRRLGGDAAVNVDKIARLDAGLDTERVGVGMIINIVAAKEPDAAGR